MHTSVKATVSGLCFEILYIFWELELRLSRDGWEPSKEQQGACFCQERLAATAHKLSEMEEASSQCSTGVMRAQEPQPQMHCVGSAMLLLTGLGN